MVLFCYHKGKASLSCVWEASGCPGPPGRNQGRPLPSPLSPLSRSSWEVSSNGSEGSTLPHAPAPYSDWASVPGFYRSQLLGAVVGQHSSHLLPALPSASRNHRVAEGGNQHLHGGHYHQGPVGWQC